MTVYLKSLVCALCRLGDSSNFLPAIFVQSLSSLKLFHCLFVVCRSPAQHTHPHTGKFLPREFSGQELYVFEVNISAPSEWHKHPLRSCSGPWWPSTLVSLLENSAQEYQRTLHAD
ncbi:hypothetical protein VTO42DRAFT_6338 [Malbranchea cinnamomea]